MSLNLNVHAVRDKKDENKREEKFNLIQTPTEVTLSIVGKETSKLDLTSAGIPSAYVNFVKNLFTASEKEADDHLNDLADWVETKKSEGYTIDWDFI